METGKSGHFDIPGNWGFTIRIYWSEGYDINSNQSTVTITKAQVMSSNWYGVTYYMNGTISVAGTTVVTMSSGQGTHSLRINGQNAFYDITGNPAAPWSSGNIKHDDDGTKAITISVSLTGYTTSGNYGNGWTASGSTTISLTAIPRKSSLTAANGTLGAKQTLTVAKKLSSYTHTITYKCGSASGTVCTKSSETSIDWTPSIDLARQNTTGTSVSVVLTIETFNGNTSLGSESVTISCYIPETVVPSVSLSVSDATSYFAAYGSYIQNKSQAKVTAAGAGVYGSTVKSYAIFCGTISGSGSSGIFNLPQAGTVTVTVTATDSRGRSASASATIAVTAYNAPIAEITSRYRCDANGNENYLGAYAIAVFNAVVTSLGGKNSAYYALKYRIRGTTAWTSISIGALTGNYAPWGIAQIFPAGIDNNYDVCIAVTDNFGTVESAYRTVQMGSPIMDADRDHRALAFFQRAVDSDTVAFGEYVKFNAGTNLDMPRYNLLDNSDFRNSVNQRGQTRYTGYGTTIDRWGIWSINGDATLTVGPNGITFYQGEKGGTLTQRIQKGILNRNKSYTFACEKADGNIVISIQRPGDSNGAITFDFNNGECDLVTLAATAETFLWAALYEGEYTAETLPEYQPKGYGAELAECQRYLLYGTLMGIPTNRWGAFIGFFIPTPVTMRNVNPSVVGTFTVHTTVSPSDAVNCTLINTVVYSNGVYVYLQFDSSADAGKVCSLEFDAGSGLSSDL